MLTQRQRDLLTFIKEFIFENGYSPSFVEMTEAIGLKNKSGVHRILTALEERGYIYRLKNRARAIEVLSVRSVGSLDQYSDMEILEEAHRRKLIELTVA
jgi:repressor LexA